MSDLVGNLKTVLLHISPYATLCTTKLMLNFAYVPLDFISALKTSVLLIAGFYNCLIGKYQNGLSPSLVSLQEHACLTPVLMCQLRGDLHFIDMLAWLRGYNKKKKIHAQLKLSLKF